MKPDIIAAIIAGLSSLIVGCITFYKTQRLRFFDVYFNRKSEAYSEYIRAAIHYIETNEGFESVYFNFHVAKMYCSKEALKELDELSKIIVRKDIKEFVVTLDKATEIFRKDLQSCRKHKFE